ncbi:MAG TPA: hypothetical protein VFI29_18090 [Hanamia sp.]|nr:hypothetical protein [Hanamia sp.]
MKFYKQIGFAASLLLVISCFLPWAYYPDVQKSFNGFYSEQGVYGKPGKVFIFFAVCSLILIFVDRIWAKRTLIFISAFNVGYLIRTYILYTTCYGTFCPRKEYGIYLLILSCIILMGVSFFPDLKVKDEEVPQEGSPEK